MLDGFSSNPALSLFQRELLVFSRDRRLFGLLASITGILVAATAILLLRSDLTSIGLASFARNLFRTQFYLIYFVALVIIPGAAATIMVSERRQDTHALLYTTLISPFWIVWGKALALVGILGVMFVGLLPFTGVVYFFAGMETQALFQYAILLFSLAFCTSSIGLLASSIALNHGRALFLTFFAVLAMLGSPSVFLGVVHLIGLPISSWFGLIGLGSTFNLISTGVAGWTQTLFFAAYQVGVAFAALRMAQIRAVADTVSFESSSERSVLHWVTHGRTNHGLVVDDGKNFIAGKDRLVNPLGRGLWPRVLGFAGVFAVGIIPLSEYFAGSTPGVHLSDMVGSLLSIILPAMIALHVMADREKDTWDNLRATLVSGRELAIGKLWGAWLVIRPFVLGLLAGRVCLYVAVGALGLREDEYPTLIHVTIGLLSLLVNIGTTMVFALYGAIHRSTTTGAVIMAYVASIGIPLLASIPLGLLMIPILVTSNWTTMGTGSTDYWALLLTPAIEVYFVLIALHIYRKTVAALERELVAGDE